MTLSIERGEIFGFVGSNGCGMSTIMKMLTGLLPATEGVALLFGKTVSSSDLTTRRRVGYMSQAFSLYTELTVRQNLVLHAQLSHVPLSTRIADSLYSPYFNKRVVTSSRDADLGMIGASIASRSKYLPVSREMSSQGGRPLYSSTWTQRW